VRADAEILDDFRERSAIVQADRGILAWDADEIAAAMFTGREAVVVSLYRAQVKAKRDAAQPGALVDWTP